MNSCTRNKNGYTDNLSHEQTSNLGKGRLTKLRDVTLQRITSSIRKLKTITSVKL